MRRLASLLAALAVAVAAPASAQYVTDDYKGTLTTTGTTINSATVAALNGNGATGATASGLGPGPYTVQCDAATYIRLVPAYDSTVTSSNGMLVNANQPFPVAFGARLKFLAVISVSGTANCKVFQAL